VGAWMWDPELGLGIVTELDETEAYQNLRAIRNTIITLTLLSMLLVIGMVWVIISNRRRKQAEKAIEKSESKFRNLVEGSLQGILVHRDFKLLFANQQCADIFGYDNPEAILKLESILEAFWPPEEQERIRDYKSRRMAGDEVPSIYETRGIRKDGSPFWFENHVTLIDWQGEKAVQAAIIDITERKQAEKAIEESESKFRNLVEGSLQGILVHRDFKLLFANQQCADIFGYDNPEAILSLDSILEAFWAPEEQERILGYKTHRMAGDEVPPIYETRGMRKDGSSFWFENHVTLINWQGKKAIQATVIDITERKRVEEALRESEQYNRMLFQETTFGLHLCRMNGQLVDVNPAYAQILGRTVEETLQLSYWDVTPEKYAEEEKAQLECLKKTGGYGPYEKEYIHADGHLVPVRLSGHILEKDGEKFIWSGAEDITERKRAETALSQSEARLAQFFNSAFEPLFFHEGGRIVDINPAGTEIGGYEYGEMIGMNMLEFVHPDSHQAVIVAMEAGGTDVPLEVDVVKKDGAKIPVVIHAKELEFEGRSIRAVSLYDITERRQAEEALRKAHDDMEGLVEERTAQLQRSESLYRGLFNNAGLGIILYDFKDNGRFLQVNDAFINLIGYERDELLTKNVIDITYAEDLTASTKYLHEVREGKKQGIHIEKRYVCKDGTILWCEVDSKVIKDTGDNALYGIGIVSDITQRKRAEDALHNLVEGTASSTGGNFFRVLVRHMAKALEVRYAFIGETIKPEKDTVRTLAVWSGTDFETNFNYDLSGAPCENVINMNDLRAYPQDIQGLFPADQLLVEMGAESYVGVPLCASTGERLGILVVVDDKPMQDLDLSKSIMSIFAGRAAAELERKRAEELERQHMLELAHISRLSTMGEMATELAHELNQPLTAISNYGEAALNLVTSDLSVSDDVKDALQEITNQTYLAGEIIRRLRAFIRKEASPRIQINVNEMVKEVLQLTNVESRWQGIFIFQDLGNQLPEVVIDKILIEQVLINLIRNAIEAMGSEQVSERRLTIRTMLNDRDEIEIAISDNGSGLTSAELEKAFDSFYTTKEDGMGMGLSISRSIIEAHDGNLWANSTPGEGTTFRFTLPGIIVQEVSLAD